MITLRCTQKLLKKFQIDGPTESGTSTNLLGDWYANIIYTRQGHYIVCVSEKSLLPIILSARDLNSFVPRFKDLITDVLLALGIPNKSVVGEIIQMYPFFYGRTKSRIILGTLNDFTKDLKFMLPQNDYSELEWSLYFAETPCGPLDYKNPIEVTRKLFDV